MGLKPHFLLESFADDPSTSYNPGGEDSSVNQPAGVFSTNPARRARHDPTSNSPGSAGGIISMDWQSGYQFAYDTVAMLYTDFTLTRNLLPSASLFTPTPTAWTLTNFNANVTSAAETAAPGLARPNLVQPSASSESKAVVVIHKTPDETYFTVDFLVRSGTYNMKVRVDGGSGHFAEAEVDILAGTPTLNLSKGTGVMEFKSATSDIQVVGTDSWRWIRLHLYSDDDTTLTITHRITNSDFSHTLSSAADYYLHYGRMMLSDTVPTWPAVNASTAVNQLKEGAEIIAVRLDPTDTTTLPTTYDSGPLPAIYEDDLRSLGRGHFIYRLPELRSEGRIAINIYSNWRVSGIDGTAFLHPGRIMLGEAKTPDWDWVGFAAGLDPIAPPERRTRSGIRYRERRNTTQRHTLQFAHATQDAGMDFLRELRRIGNTRPILFWLEDEDTGLIARDEHVQYGYVSSEPFTYEAVEEGRYRTNITLDEVMP